jgi:hypothetical protein
MKSKGLLRLYLAQISLPGTEPVEEGETAAMLFGTDEIKVDAKKGAIRFPDLGWMACDLQGMPGSFDWAAIVKCDEGWNVVLGVGNPYESKLSTTLPHKNGRIVAVPHSAVAHFGHMAKERRIGEA